MRTYSPHLVQYLSPEPGAGDSAGPAGAGTGTPAGEAVSSPAGSPPAAPGAPDAGVGPGTERPVRRFVARLGRQQPAPAPAQPQTPAAPSAPTAPAPAPAPDGALAARLAALEAQQRTAQNERVFGELAGATTLKAAYTGIVRGLVTEHLGADANLADPKVRQKAAAFLDTLPAKLPDLFAPKAERRETQSEWAARLADSRAKNQIPKRSILGQMSPAQVEALLKGGR